MPESDVTLGEVARRITAMEQRVNQQFQHVNQRLDGLQFVSRDTYAVQMQSITDRLEDLEDARKWVARTVGAAFLVAFLAPVFVALVVTR